MTELNIWSKRLLIFTPFEAKNEQRSYYTSTGDNRRRDNRDIVLHNYDCLWRFQAKRIDRVAIVVVFTYCLGSNMATIQKKETAPKIGILVALVLV